jgi:hypothetical protein
MQGNGKVVRWFAWKPKENFLRYPHDSLVTSLLMAACRKICTDCVRIQKVELMKNSED